MTTDYIKQSAEVLNEAEAIFISAGAGIGVDSGLPDFRGTEGFWKAYPPIAKLGISFAEMANPEWFRIKPKLAWAFYGHRLNMYRNTVPHGGFKKLLKISEAKPGGYFVFTSNVDGHFQKAGFNENRIVECHGSIHHFQCSLPCGNDIWSAANETVNVNEVIFEALEPLPACIKCGKTARPNILMFGDWNWIPERTDRQGNILSRWLNEIREKKLKLAVIELGAGEYVPTVRRRSEYIAGSFGGTLIRINPRDHNVSKGNIPLPLKSAEAIEMIAVEMKIK